MLGLTIYLGSRCNLKCPYCHREATTEGPISQALLDFIRGKKDLRIKFMGGEPTLYMNEIRKVVDAAPEAEYAIATNGIGLSEYLGFFREHRFLVCISYDGTDLRGFDPFTSLLDYPWLSVSCTLYHGNTNFKQILKRFEEKERIIGRPLSFFPHIVHCTGESNKPFALTPEDYDFIFMQYKDCLNRYFEEYRRGVINVRFQGLFAQLLRRYEAEYSFGETYCVNRNLRKIDATGKPFSCLYIRDNDLSGGWQEKQMEILKAKFPRCETCPAYDMCGAGCIKSTEHELECSFYYRLYTWFKEKYNEEFLRLPDKHKAQDKHQ